MGFEMIKDKLVITPQRLYSLVRLVREIGSIGRPELLTLLQPAAVSDNGGTSGLVYRYARRYGLIEEDETTQKSVSLAANASEIDSMALFRSYMQKTLLGVTSESQNNFLLSQFTAWYAAQNDSVLSYSKTDYEAKFHEALYPSASERVLAEQPGISAWRVWAEFLGWGWAMKFDGRDEMRIVPDATERIRPLLPRLMPEANTNLPMGDFVANLGKLCPELDGGVLFSRCWEASRGSDDRGNQLSLMVSTAFRVLHASKEITLVERKDASVAFQLFPAQSHMSRVTDIRREIVT